MSLFWIMFKYKPQPDETQKTNDGQTNMINICKNQAVSGTGSEVTV